MKRHVTSQYLTLRHPYSTVVWTLDLFSLHGNVTSFMDNPFKTSDRTPFLLSHYYISHTQHARSQLTTSIAVASVEAKNIEQICL